MKRRCNSLAEYFEKHPELTHGALAARLNVSRSYVTLLVSGDRQPALDLAILISKETGVPVEALVSEAKAS